MKEKFSCRRIVFILFRIIPLLKKRFYVHLNRILFSIIGISYGKNMQVRNKVYVENLGVIKIGDNFTFSSGDNTNSVSRNICGSMHVMSADARIIIGENVGISAACLRSMESILIGDNVNIGADSLIMDNDSHPHFYIERRKETQLSMKRNDYLKLIPKDPIIIDDDVWIGARCMILKGVHIGARSIIAAGSIVTKDIPADSIAAGNPARVIKHLNISS